MDNRILVNYLEGEPIRDIKVWRRALERGDVQGFRMSEEDLARRELAYEGPQIILPVLHTTLRVLRNKGERLALIMKETAELAKTLGPEEAGRRNYVDEMNAGLPLDDVLSRVAFLINEIADASPQSGARAGRQLETALRDRDARMRILAAIHSVTKGIPAKTVSDTLTSLLYNDQHPAVKYAAASALLGLSESQPAKVNDAAQRKVMSFYEVVSRDLPGLVARVKRDLKEKSEDDRILMTTVLALHHGLAV